MDGAGAGVIRVLLVDDAQDVRRALRTHLATSPHFEVVGEASDGGEAMLAVHQLQPSVVVMDINMPKLDGIRATAWIKRALPHVKVVGLSVFANEEARELMMAAGATAVVAKEEAFEYLGPEILKSVDRRSTQKAAQRAAMEARSRLAVTLSSIGDAVVASDTDSRITFVNPVAEKLLGYSQPDLIGRALQDVFNIINEDTRRPVPNPVERVLREGNVVGLANHTVLVRPDGLEIPIADSGAPIRDSDGSILGVVLVFRDVTEQQQMARMAALLSAIVNSSDDAIITKDFAGTITSWNEGAERIFGYTAQEMIGQSIRVLIPPDRQDEEADILQRLSRGQHIKHYETVRRKKNGQLCDISLTISPLKDARGHLIGASKIARDITELKWAQRALHESQERWRVTLESIADGVIATDTEGHVTFANAAALGLLGRPRSAVVGTLLTEVFPIVNEFSRHSVGNPVGRVIREGTVIGLANHTLLLRPDGTEIPIADSAAPIHDSRGRLVGVVLVFRQSPENR